MVFSDIYNDVADQFGDTSAAMIVRIKRYINWAQQDVCSRLDEADFLFDDDHIYTVDGTSTYTLAATAEKIIKITCDTNETALSHITRSELEELDPSRSTTGTPTHWTEYGRDATTGAMIIELYPVPDDAVQVDYSFRKSCTDLSGDDDVSIIPFKYHRILYLGAVAQCYDYDQDPSSLTYWTQYENLLETMKTDLMSGSEDKKSGFRPFGGYKGNATLRLPPDHFNN